MRGSVTDLLFALPLIVVVGFLIVIFGAVAATISDAFADNPNIVDTPSANITDVLQNTEDSYGALNNMFPLFVLGGIGLTAVILGITVRSRPALAIFSILLGMIIIFVGVYVGNAYEIFASSSFVAPTATNFTAVSFIFENLAALLLGLIVLIMIALYGKGARDEGL